MDASSKAAAALGFIGVGHTAVISVLLWEPLMGLLARGWVGALGHDALEAAAFWSLYFGFAVCLAGLAVVRSRWGPLGFLVLGLSGGAAAPISGFWLAIPASFLWWRALDTDR